MLNNSIDKITIMNFSHVYEQENFYLHDNINWIDCTDIKGTDCYCDDTAKKMITDKIKPYSPHGLHFIDSGNYHYISEFWMNKIPMDFVLIVFDHHSDMQKPLFGDIMTCGSWILNALEENEHLKKVVLIGIGKDQENVIGSRFCDKLICINSIQLSDEKTWQELSRIKEKLPVYISLDKDVLSKKVVDTSWDQGTMKMTELKELLHMILSKQEIIGIDICGENTDIVGQLYEIHNNDLVNEKLLQFLKNSLDIDAA